MVLTIRSDADILSNPRVEEQEKGPLAELVRRLLALGGNSIDLPEPPVARLHLLLARGKVLEGEVLLLGGRLYHCHTNTVMLWAAKEGEIRIATGFALMQDDFWVQHSWGVEGTVAPYAPGGSRS